MDPVDMAEALRRIDAFPEDGCCRQVITANPLMLLAAEKDAGLREAFAAADLVVPDGAGLRVAAALRGFGCPRVPGIELMDHLCAGAAIDGGSVYLLGAAPGVAEAAGRVLAAKHPNLRIAGIRHGHFPPSEEEGVIGEIAQARPDFLFVALSTPFQDAWIHRNLGRLGARVAMGVGGSFDVFAGRLRRAPGWMGALGLEWLFRLLQEPRRWRRMLGLPVFLIKSALCPTRKTR